MDGRVWGPEQEAAPLARPETPSWGLQQWLLPFLLGESSPSSLCFDPAANVVRAGGAGHDIGHQPDGVIVEAGQRPQEARGKPTVTHIHTPSHRTLNRTLISHYPHQANYSCIGQHSLAVSATSQHIASSARKCDTDSPGLKSAPLCLP